MEKSEGLRLSLYTVSYVTCTPLGDILTHTDKHLCDYPLSPPGRPIARTILYTRVVFKAITLGDNSYEQHEMSKVCS